MSEEKVQQLNNLMDVAVKEFQKVLETYRTGTIRQGLADLETRAEELKRKRNLNDINQVTFSDKDEVFLQTTETLKNSHEVLNEFTLLSEKIVTAKERLRTEMRTAEKGKNGTRIMGRETFSSDNNTSEWGYVKNLEDCVCEIFHNILVLKDKTEQEYVSL